MPIPLMFDFRRSIRARLAVVAGIICFLFFLGFAGGLGETLRIRSERAARTELEGLSLRMTNLLDESMYMRYSDLEIAAGLPSVRNAGVSRIIQRTILQNIQHAHREFAWIGLTDASGIVRASTDGLLEEVDVSAQPWFAGAAAGPYFGDVHEAVLLNQLLRAGDDEPLRFVDIATPVYDQNNEFAGVLGAHLNWTWAAEVQRATQMPLGHHPGLEAFILSAEGAVLLGPADSFDLSPLLAADGDRARPVSRVAQLRAEETYLAGLMRSRGYRDYPGLGWTSVVIQPTTHAFAVARDVQRTILVWGLAISTLLVATLWFITGQIVRPLTSIAQAADRIRVEGNGGEMPIIAGQDEVASLSRSLYTLIGRLRNSVDRLQTLRTIDRAILQTQGLTPTLEVVVEQTQRILGVDAVDILLFDPHTDELRFAAGAGFQTDAFRHAPLPVGSGIRSRIMAERKTILIDDVTTFPGIVRADAFRMEEFVGYAGTPLVNHDTLVGVLELHSRTRLTPDNAWREFLESLALQTTIAIQHVRLFAETRSLLAQTEQQARELSRILESVPGGVLLLDEIRCVHHQNSLAREYLANVARRDEAGRLQSLGNRTLDELLVPVRPGEPWHEVADADGARIYEIAAYELMGTVAVDMWVMVIVDVTLERQRLEHGRRLDRLATVGQLAAGIAHDFNNILTPIFLYSYLLERSAQDAKARTGLQNILKAAGRARDLITQILAFSRVRPASGGEAVQLQPIIGEVLTLLEAVAPATIVVRQEVAPQVGPIRGDGSRIHQVLMNLCTNAFQAMPHGGTLTIGLRATTLTASVLAATARTVPGRTVVRSDVRPGSVYAHLSIRDTGAGMDAATLARIFEPFFTTKSASEGTGMGLAVVHEVIMEHDGLIDVESVVGQGTTFHIYLPLDTDAAAGHAIVATPEEAGGGRLLIVDDEEIILVASKDALESYGYTVTTMLHSQDVLTALRQDPHAFDLVVTDLNMAYLAGDDLIREMRKLRPDLPVVLMSGSGKLLSGTRVQEAQATRILPKPFTIQELILAVQTALALAKEPHDDA